MKSVALLFIIMMFLPPAMADVKSSKVNSYSVVAPPDGVAASKVNAYSVVAPPDGVAASKVNAYSVVAPPDGVSASKVNAYSVVAPPDGVAASKIIAYAVIEIPSNVQPNIFIFTKLGVKTKTDLAFWKKDFSSESFDLFSTFSNPPL